MASFVGALDGFIVNVALPTISSDLDGGLVLQQWVVDAYLITLGAFILLAGSLSDLFGRSRVLIAGLIGFGVSSLLCAIAPNGEFLIAGRALQGVAGALLVPSSLAMIISAFDGPAQAKAIGTWTAWFSIAALTGPLLGGVILGVGSWRWIFAINVVPIGVALWLIQKLEHPPNKQRTVSLDVRGAVLCVVGLALAVFGLIEQPARGWTRPVVLWSLAIGVAALFTFVWYEARIKHPMLPLSLFSKRNFAVGNVATLAVYGGLSVATFLLVITLQQLFGLSALLAGMALLPVTVIMFLFSSKFGALAGKYGPRLFMGLGPIIAALGFLLMGSLDKPFNYVTQLLPGVLIFAFGLAITVAPLTSAILGIVEKERAGIASAVNNAIARIAGLLTIAFIGAVTGPNLTLVGFKRGMMFTAALLVMGGLISLVGIQNKPKASA